MPRYPHKIDIYEQNITNNTSSFKTTYVEKQKNVSCHIQDQSAFESIRAGRKALQKERKIYFPFSTNIVKKDRVLFNSIFYDVVEQGEWLNKYKKVIVEEVDN